MQVAYWAVYNLTQERFVEPIEKLTLLRRMMGGEGGQVMEEFGMARQSKREYLRSIYERYRGGRRTEKTAMLEEFCKVCGYNRKYAIGLLSRPLKARVPRRPTPRSAT